MTIPAITAIPAPPSSTDSATFDTLADAFLGSFPTLQSQINATTAAFVVDAAAAVAAAVAAAAGGGDLANTNLTGVKAIGFYAEYDNGNSGAADTITLANGQKQKSTLTGNATLTISTVGALIGSYQLRLIQDATGSRAVTWAGLTSTRWLGSVGAPSINSAIAGETIVTMYFDGVNITQSLSKVGAV